MDKKYIIDKMDGIPPTAEELESAYCAMECGNLIGTHYDDMGGWYQETPKHGYAACCRNCFIYNPHSER